MLCPNCKHEIAANSKFCNDCGAKIPEVKPVSTPKKKEEDIKIKNPKDLYYKYKRNIVSILLFCLFLCLLYFIYPRYFNYSTKITLIIICLIFIAVLTFSLGIEFIRFSIDFLKLSFKKPILFIIPLILTIILIPSFLFIRNRNKFEKSYDQILLIQDLFAETAAMKSYSEDIKQGREVPEGLTSEIIKEQLSITSDELAAIKPSDMLLGYFNSVNTWIISVNNANLDFSSIPEKPKQFSIALSETDLTKATADVIERLSILKESGDLAIAYDDKIAMRRIAIRLLVLDHWVTSLEYAEDPGFFSSNFLEQVYAEENSSVKRNPCVYNRGKSACLAQVSRIIPGVYRSAYGYSVGEASETWTTAWDEESLNILSVAGYDPVESGVTIGEDEESKTSPLVKDFSDSCKSKGGIVGGTGGVMTGLPTTESGYNCWYGNNKCWDLLTYSGSFYSGGSFGCPENGLIRNDDNIFDDLIESFDDFVSDDSTNEEYEEIEFSFDGYYNLEYTSSYCNVPGWDASMLNPYSTNGLEVHDNEVVMSDGEVYDINEDGTVQISYSYSAYNIQVEYQDTIVFQESNGVGVASGEYSIYGYASDFEYGVDINLECSGSYEGTQE